MSASKDFELITLTLFQQRSIQKDIGIPPPEMVFGSNRITFATDKVAIEFNAYDALRYVDTSPESSEYIKVAYANEWTRKRYILQQRVVARKDARLTV